MNDKRKIKEVYNLIQNLRKIPGNNLSFIIENLSDHSIDNICECVYNIIHTDLKLSKRKKNQLKKCIKENCSIPRLKKISNKKIAISKRRKALSMEGKGLGLLLSAAIPFLTNLIFGKRNE